MLQEQLNYEANRLQGRYAKQGVGGMMIKETERKEPNLIDVYIGGQIRYYRRLRSMTQKGLGCIIGVKFQQVQKYEDGSNRVGSSRMVAICDALEIDVSDMFGKYSRVDNPVETRPISAKAGKLVNSYMKLGRDDQNHLLRIAEALTLKV